jgi:hypothetical protein
MGGRRNVHVVDREGRGRGIGCLELGKDWVMPDEEIEKMMVRREREDDGCLMKGLGDCKDGLQVSTGKGEE